MPTIDWPEALIPQTAQLTLRKAGTQFVSPFNGTLQALDFIAERWTLSASLAQMSARNPRGVDVFCNRLSGGVERVRVWPFTTGGVPRGTLRGTPALSAGVVRGATVLPIGNASGVGNLLVSPDDLIAAAWTGPASVTANTHSAPDGSGLTADTITDSSTTSAQNRQQVVAVPADTQAYTLSCYVRKTSGGVQPSFGLLFLMSGGTPQNSNPRLNSDTGALVAGGGPGSVQDAGAYWRLSTTLANNGTNNLITVSVVPAIAAFGQATQDVSVTGSAVVWGFQLERSASVGAYVGRPTIQEGDFLGCGGQLFQVAGPASFAGGFANVPVINRVRAPIASGSPVTWYRPACEMVLPAMQAGPVRRPGVIESTALDLVEVW
jgi:hypothetical protein